MKQDFTSKQPARWVRLLTVLLLGTPLLGHGQTSVPTAGTAVSQTFDGLATSTAATNNSTTNTTFTNNITVPGWYSSATAYRVSDGGTNSGALYSYGTLAASDRALGSLASSSTTYIYGWRLKNTTGQPVTSVTVSFTGEQWRVANATAQKLAFSYQTGATVTSVSTGTFVAVTALDFTSPVLSATAAALDGNATANRTAITSTITGLSIANNEEIMIRWSDVDDAGSDHGLAVDDVNVTFTAAPACNAPTALASSNVTTTTADVTFTGSGSATGYTVTTSPVTTTQTLPAGATSASFTGLTAGTAYTVSIVSNCAGSTTSSAATTTFTTSASTSCAAPTALTSANVTTTTADVTFTGSSSATGYTVTTSPVTTTQTLPAGATSVSFMGLTAGTAYTVSIVSNCAGSTMSSAATTTFTTTSACAAPTALASSNVTNSTATVNFTGSGSATGYTVTTSPVTTTQTLPAGATSVSFTGLTAGTAYTVSIVSNCAGGATATAATTTFTTTSACAAPTGLTPANVTTTTADVTFTGSGSATGYTVTTSPVTTTQTLPAGATSVSFTGLTASTAYTVSIVSNCAGGATATVATTTFTTSSPPPAISIAAVNTPYTENFNTLATSGTANSIGTLPLGWTFQEADTNANTTYRADDGGSSTGDTFSYGTGTNSDRAFGTLASGSLQSTIGAAYINNTGAAITSLLISYTGELWRLAVLTGRSDRLDFSYSTGGGTFASATYTAFTALSFATPATADVSTAVGARNGNLAANRAAVTATIPGLNIAPGATFFIRWVDPDINGNDDGLAVDDFSLTANPVPVVPCGAPAIASIGGITTTTASVSLTPGTNGGTTFTVTATPTAGGTAITATGTSPVSLTGLAAGTSYSVTATSTCNAGFSSPSATSVPTALTTAAPTATLAVTQGATSYPSGGTAYDFGNQTVATTSAPVAFTLTNSGNGALTISGITTTGDFAVSGTAPTTVAAGGTATVSVTFTPTAMNARTGTLVINSNATAAATYTVNLAGTGTAVPAPEIDVLQGATPYASGSTYNGFPTTTVGSFSPVSFTVQNTGSAPLIVASVVASGDYTANSPATPFAIAAGSSATVSAVFGPTAPGTRTGTLTIANNDSDEATYVINLSGNATAAALPNLTVSTGTSTSPTPIAGNYNNVIIASGGNAIVAGPLTVAGALTVQANGLLIQNCQAVTGTGDFVLQAGGALAICDGAGIYATGALGAIRLSGTRTYSLAAAYVYNGTVGQATGPGLPAQVAALGVNNAAGVTLSQAVAVAQQVTLQLGNLNTGGQTFTLLSSAVGTAVLDNGLQGSVVNGTATVQRYINNPNPIGYRHYSAPVSNTTLNDLATSGFTPVFNASYNSSPTPNTVTPFPTVFGYDQNRLATVTSTYVGFDKGWFSPAASSTPMAVNRGYTVNAPSTALVDFVGVLNNGAQGVGGLTYTSAEGGWQLLGNPYPAPLDWNTVVATQRPGMEAGMYVFQSSGQYGGSYRTFANGMGGSSLIPTASGYFVRVAAAGGNGAVNLTNGNRVLTFDTQPAFGRSTADTRPRLQLLLSGTAADLDEAYIYFEAGATAGRDAEYDATKLANPSGLNMASLAGGQELAINGLPVLGNAAVLVPLTAQVPQAGSYRLQAADLANFTGTATLIDALTGARTVLATGTSYAFVMTGTSATGRFSVEFRAANVLAATPAQALNAQVRLFPNPASSSFRLQLPVLSSKAAVSAALVNALGQTVLTRSLSAPAGQAIDAAFDVRGLAAGVYTLRLNVDGTSLVRKVVVE